MQKASVSFGYGIKKEYTDIYHKCNTDPGASGSLILNLSTNKVIGIHKCYIGSPEVNIGSFLKDPLLEYERSFSVIIRNRAYIPINDDENPDYLIYKHKKNITNKIVPQNKKDIISQNNEKIDKKNNKSREQSISNNNYQNINLNNNLRQELEFNTKKPKDNIINNILPDRKKQFVAKSIYVNEDKFENLNINEEVKRSERNNANKNDNYICKIKTTKIEYMKKNQILYDSATKKVSYTNSFKNVPIKIAPINKNSGRRTPQLIDGNKIFLYKMVLKKRIHFINNFINI